MDLNEATLEILMERIEDLEERVRMLEISLDTDNEDLTYDDFDYDILPDGDLID